jgi:hypothetical protein
VNNSSICLTIFCTSTEVVATLVFWKDKVSRLVAYFLWYKPKQCLTVGNDWNNVSLLETVEICTTKPSLYKHHIWASIPCQNLCHVPFATMTNNTKPSLMLWLTPLPRFTRTNKSSVLAQVINHACYNIP